MKSGRAMLGRRRSRWKTRTRDPWLQRPLGLAALERLSTPQRIARLIRGRIIGGDVRPGRRLEPMRVLASDLGVSLPSVREAIAQLRGEGLVEVRHGVGCFVSRRPRRARVLRASVRDAARHEAAEMRLTTDPAVARAAARRATPATLRELVSAMFEREAASRSRNPAAYVEADHAFHLALARAARGPLAIAAHRMTVPLLGPMARATAARDTDDLHLSMLHRSLVDAVERGREHRAARAARLIAWHETRPP
ncbi:MAG TPA: GntR family transcriptional regulator [Candidatus Limnocylindria bacterium]